MKDLGSYITEYINRKSRKPDYRNLDKLTMQISPDEFENLISQYMDFVVDDPDDSIFNKLKPNEIKCVLYIEDDTKTYWIFTGDSVKRTCYNLNFWKGKLVRAETNKGWSVDSNGEFNCYPVELSVPTNYIKTLGRVKDFLNEL